MQCTARSKRTGEQCGARAVTGKNVCRMHGGAPASGRPPVHGRYSTALQEHPAFLEAYERMRDDPHIEETRNEIALQRAILDQFLSRYGVSVLNGQLLPILQGLTAEISKTVERRQKMQFAADQAITARHLETMAAAFLDAAREVFDGDDRLALFVERVRSLSAPSPTGPGQ